VPNEAQYVLIFAAGAAVSLAAAGLIAWGLPAHRRPSNRRTGLSVAGVEADDVYGAAGVEVPTR
jgi:hypothetical protein